MNDLVSSETGGFMFFEVALLQLLSDNKTDFTKLNSNFALYMQFRNDYYNLCLQEVMSKLSVQGS
jgi:hypothetical protein